MEGIAFPSLDETTSKWSDTRTILRRPLEVFEVDAWNMINAKFDILMNKLDRMNMNAVEASGSSSCLYGRGYQNDECQFFSQDPTFEQIVYLNNNNQRPVGNPNSNRGWRNHSNYSWTNQQNQSHNFQQGPPLPHPPQLQELKSNLELLMENLLIAQKQQDEAIKHLTAKVDQLATHNKMLENQIAQQTSSDGQMLERKEEKEDDVQAEDKVPSQIGELEKEDTELQDEQQKQKEGDSKLDLKILPSHHYAYLETNSYSVIITSLTDTEEELSMDLLGKQRKALITNIYGIKIFIICLVHMILPCYVYSKWNNKKKLEILCLNCLATPCRLCWDPGGNR